MLSYLLEDDCPGGCVDPHGERLGAEQQPEEALAEEHLDDLNRIVGQDSERSKEA